MFAAAVALICTAYVLYMTVFEQVISQNQGYFYAVIFGFILTIRLSETENQTGHHVMLGPVSFLVGTSMDTLTNVVVMMIVILVMYVFLWRK